MREQLNRLLRPLADRISGMVAVGILRRIDPGANQQCQVELQEDVLRDQLPHHLPYGFAHVPLEGAEPLVVYLRGDASGGLVIQIRDPRHQPTLASGEVALYDDQQQIVHISRNGIHIETDKPVIVKGSTINIEASQININGECYINGIKQIGS
jgi:phage gp45-like